MELNEVNDLSLSLERGFSVENKNPGKIPGFIEGEIRRVI